MEKVYIPIFTIIISFIINLLITPVVIKISHAFKWYDSIDNRKIHTGFIPRLGGIGIFLSLIISAFVVSAINYFITGNLTSGIIDFKYIPILLSLILIHILGLTDDFFSQKAIVKLVFQILAALIVVVGGFVIHKISIPYIGSIDLGLFAYPFTIGWIIIITNAVNLVDGMDGLAGGIVTFAALSLGIISLIQGQIVTAIFSFCIFGATAGFLTYNLPPAKVFMGDSGSLFLGFSLAIIPLMGISKSASFGSILVPITLLLVPLLDTIAAIVRRIKEKRKILSPDRDHIHHKLLDMGLSERQILALIYSVCLYLSIIAITSVVMPKESNVYIILIVWIGSMIGYGFIHYLNMRRKMVGIDEKAREKNSA
jgi:UDP-GlcNAc:undecaprenyl-phosphate GlcNAc-1-phosphate transferase